MGREAEHIDQQDALKQWDAWIATAQLKGGRMLHGWAKLPQNSFGHTMAVGAAGPTISGTGLLGALWSNVQWQQSCPVCAEPGPPISEEELVWASGSFGPWAAQSQDGFHPAHYKLAGGGVLGLVIRMLRCWETGACLPIYLQWLTSFLVSKPNHKGFRLINLF